MYIENDSPTHNGQWSRVVPLRPSNINEVTRRATREIDVDPSLGPMGVSRIVLLRDIAVLCVIAAVFYFALFQGYFDFLIQ